MHALQRSQCKLQAEGSLSRRVAAQRESHPGGFNCNSRGARLSSKSRTQAVSGLSAVDLERLTQAAELSQQLVGVTAPHPNAGCMLFSPSGQLVGSAAQRAQGSTPSEVLAAAAAREAARGSTAYLNLETGDCHGEEAAVSALVAAGVRRVVVGLRHPLAHLRDTAIHAYTGAGLEVCVLGEAPLLPVVDAAAADAALLSCLSANEALLHRAVLKRPLSVLKYAMTLDGKIATAAGHSAWVSSPASRAVVFEHRAASDAVVVGGNTLRRDNPRLTTRRDSGHLPVRVVMSRTLDLPEVANLWDTQAAPTIVMTQRGARKHFQQFLRSKGVEVVEFDFLTPEAVADYCYERGFLQVFWECGGTLAAPAIASGVIHKVLAFVAPKIIGGARAPTPVGELGNVEMTQAVNLADTSWQQVGPDLMMTGYLPSSGGLLTLERACSYAGNRAAAAAAAAVGSSSSSAAGSSAGGLEGRNRAGRDRVISFYKAWDEWGALSNFSPHPISMPQGPVPLAGHNQHSRDAAAASSSDSSSTSGASSSSSSLRQWPSVEHFYQSQKFAGVQHADAAAVVEAIAAAESPEEAARIGRQHERQRPELLRPDWAAAKRSVMLAALRAKFAAHSGPRAMLLATAVADASHSAVHAAGVDAAAAAPSLHQPHQQQHYGQRQPAAAAHVGSSSEALHRGHSSSSSSSSSSSRGRRHSSSWGSWSSGPALLVESSPHDRYWGQGYDGLGLNTLGQLLMQVREELLTQQQQQQQQQQQHAAGAAIRQQQQQQVELPLQHAPSEVQHSLQQQQQQRHAGGAVLNGSSWQQQALQHDTPAGLAS